MRPATCVLVAMMATAPLSVAAQTIDPGDVAGRLVDLLPPRRAGQWEIKVWHLVGLREPIRVDHPSIRFCIDAASDRDTMRAALFPFAACRGKEEIKRVGDEWVLDESCEAAGIKMTRKTAISSDFEGVIVVRVQENGWGVGPVQTHTARWVAAACAAGFEPGDIEYPRAGRTNAHRPLRALRQYLERKLGTSPGSK
jgi:hypothetical protein